MTELHVLVDVVIVVSALAIIARLFQVPDHVPKTGFLFAFVLLMMFACVTGVAIFAVFLMVLGGPL